MSCFGQHLTFQLIATWQEINKKNVTLNLAPTIIVTINHSILKQSDRDMKHIIASDWAGLILNTSKH